MKAQPVLHRYLPSYRRTPLVSVSTTPCDDCRVCEIKFSDTSQWAARMRANSTPNRAPKFARLERSGYDSSKSLTATDSSVCGGRERRPVGITTFERRLLRRR